MPAKKAAKKAAKQPAKRTSSKAAKGRGSRPLTPKQKVFTEKYLANGFNGTAAAKAAGYQGNEDVLAHAAADNLRNPQIASRVRARIEGEAATADEVLNLLADHLRADLGDFATCFESNGQLNLERAKAAGLSRLVKKLKVRATPYTDGAGEPAGYEYVTEIELHDAQGAAGKLIPVLGLKQAPGENQQDAKRKQEWGEKKLAEVMRRYELTREGAVEWLREHAPTVAGFLM